MKEILLVLLIASLSFANSVYERALEKSLWDGDVNKALLMIKKGANVNTITYNNFNEMPFPSIKLLVDNGYNLNDSSSNLCVLSEIFNARPLEKNFHETVSLLLNKGANPHCIDRDGNNVIYSATLRTRYKYENYDEKLFIKTYKLLLSKANKEDINYYKIGGFKHREKYKPLNAACNLTKKGYFVDTERINLLINAGTDVNKPIGIFSSTYVKTPLECAIELNDIKLITLLLNKGANINAINNDKSPVDYAHEERKDDIEIYLLEKGAKYVKYSDLN